MTSDNPTGKPGMAGWLRVLLIIMGVVVGLPCVSVVGCVGCHKFRKMFPSGVGEAKAQEVFGSALEAIKPPPKPEPYDIDKTIRVMHAVDVALADRENLQDHLETLAMQDYRNVAPEVLQSREELLEHLKDLYALYGEEKDHEVLFAAYRKFFLVAVSDLQGVGFGPAGIDFDPEQTRKRLEKLEAEEAAQKDARRRIRETEKKLIDSLVDYSATYYKYVDEWDRVCLMRDRAYLAVADRQWDKVIGASKSAMDAAPFDNEAVLLRAMALLEKDGDSGENPLNEGSAEARDLLSKYISSNPERTAPALLLMGVAERENGNADEAKLLFDQAAAYFPKQSAMLTDKLDAYKMRAFLRKSREGRRVLELYKSTMVGAGYFSPDLQLAKLYQQQGNAAAMREKVLDHFSRRRAQGQMDYIVSDLEFCYSFLGVDFYSIFPEEFYLDLEYKPTLMGFGDSINLDVHNRSGSTLHNASLILCIQFTEMVRGDYEAFIAPKAAPAIVAGQSTDFGDLELKFDLFGKKKGVRDIVECRAVLLTNEAVIWVQTDADKLARLAQTPAVAPATTEEAPLGGLLSRENFMELLSSTEIVLDDKSGSSSDMKVRLPKELAILHPLFRLATNARETPIEPSENLIENGEIRLKFDGAPNPNRKGGPGVDLLMDTPYGKFLFGLEGDGKGGVKLKVEPQPEASNDGS